MLDDFVVRAILAGLGIVLAAAPLGCMIVWRRMAYFSDATAHASILGVALALSFSVSIFAGVLIVSLLMAVLITALNGRGFGTDTMLGVLAHSGLAFGLVAVSLMDGVRVDLTAYLFGDILSVGRFDLAIIWGGALIVLTLLCWRWSRLITSTLNPDLAYASGIDPKREQLVLTLSLAFVVAIAIKVVGGTIDWCDFNYPGRNSTRIFQDPRVDGRIRSDDWCGWCGCRCWCIGYVGCTNGPDDRVFMCGFIYSVEQP